MPVAATVGDYKGTPVLDFVDEKGFKIIMGASKLAAVVSCMPQVLKFLSDSGNGKGKEAMEAFYAKYQAKK